MMSQSRPHPDLETDFQRLYRFPLDDFQLEAIAHIREGQSVMVAAPTSSGKTIVAEYAIWRTLQAGRRAVYTTPIKALSNQKRRDLESLFPNRVGLLTGDRSENRDADVVVMTTEVLRNMLIDDPEVLDAVDCVIFDEVHFLSDRDRGTIWEESIITCPARIRLVCLSATIANAAEIADWIGQTHRPIALVRHDERPVPLEHYVFTGGPLQLIRDARGRRVRKVNPPEGRRRLRQQRVSPADLVQALRRSDLLPAIWFAFSRRGVEEDAELCAEAALELTGASRDEIENAIGWTLASLPPEDRALPQLSNLSRLLRRGIGFHHAGLLPPAKELVEDLFLRGLLSVVSATDTLAVGINMPARTVVISRMARPVGGLLTSNDFSQLTGRAGRRGIDERGAVVLIPSPNHDFERDYAEVTGLLEPVLSAFTLRYSTLLAMYDRRGAIERLAALVRSSLRQFQRYGQARAADAELQEVEDKLGALPRIPELEGRDAQLDEYLTIQGRLTAAEKSSRKAARVSNRRRRVPRAGRRPTAQETALRSLLERHPLHRLAHDSVFQAAAAERISLLRRRNRLYRTVEEAERERNRDAERTARAVASVLRRLGYIDEEGLTTKAAGLREIMAPSGIVVSELYHAGQLSDLAPAELAETLSWFASDLDRRRYNSFSLPPKLRFLRQTAVSVSAYVGGLEDAEGIRLAQGPSQWFWGIGLAWCRGESVESIVGQVELGEGDVVSLLNKTIDLLDQFTAMLRQYDDDAALTVSRDARFLLSRGLVSMVRMEPGHIAAPAIP